MAVVLDAVCLVVFVLAGRQSHGLDSGGGWFLVVLWPLVLGWYVGAVITGVYTASSHLRRRLAATIVLGVALGLVIRAATTHRDTPAAFVVVAFGFITLTAVGWRVVAAALPRLLERRRR